MKIFFEFSVMHSRSSVGLMIFTLNCSTGYFFWSISTWNYSLSLLWGILYIWLLHPLILIWHRNWYRMSLAPISMAFMIMLYLSFSSSVLRSSYSLVLYLWLCSIRLSYGIDNFITMILSFAFNRKTISGRRLLLDIVFWQTLCHPGRLADTSQFPLDARFWLGIAQCLIVCLEAEYILLHFATNFVIANSIRCFIDKLWLLLQEFSCFFPRSFRSWPENLLSQALRVSEWKCWKTPDIQEPMKQT